MLLYKSVRKHLPILQTIILKKERYKKMAKKEPKNEAKRKRTNMVTRRVVEGRVIDVYKFENGQVEKIDTIEVSGKVSEIALAKKYGVNKVMIDVVEEKKVVYGLDIDTFMSMAVKLEDEEVTEE